MFKAVKEAIINKDKKIIHEIALRQLEGGANALDVTAPFNSRCCWCNEMVG